MKWRENGNIEPRPPCRCLRCGFLFALWLFCLRCGFLFALWLFVCFVIFFVCDDFFWFALSFLCIWDLYFLFGFLSFLFRFLFVWEFLFLYISVAYIYFFRWAFWATVINHNVGALKELSCVNINTGAQSINTKSLFKTVNYTLNMSFAHNQETQKY